MGDVTLISSTMVRPGNINQPGRAKIHLTPFDLNLLYLVYPQRALIFPKPDPETRFIDRLKASLSSTLDIYFPFAGRLVKVNNVEDKTVSFHIECDNTSGAKFIHATAESVTVCDLLASNPNSFISIFPFNDVKSLDGVSEPLLALQVTEIKDGVILSFCYNHMVADGASMWNFINLWSKISLTGHVENLEPLNLRGWFLNRVNYPIWIPVSETEIKLNREISQTPSTKERIFHFTKKNIADLKAKANREIEISSSDVRISSLQALIAYLWRMITKHSGLNREEETYCKLAVDLRQRLNPPLEKECFGNAANTITATATVGDLIDHDLGWIGLLINNSVKSETDLNYKNFAENWVKNCEIPKIGVKSKMRDNSLIFTSSPWFDWYGNDFGWGKPVAVRAGPGNEIGGRFSVFRGIEEGSIDVHAALASSLWSDVLVHLLVDVESM